MSSDGFVLTKRLAKDFASLDQPKGRRRARLFVAEGSKCVVDLAPAFACRYLFALPEWLERHADHIPLFAGAEIVAAQRALLRQVSRLVELPEVVAFFALPGDEPEAPAPDYVANNLIVALDRVQDPGNLGTIVRCCDWMGVRHMVCSPDTADVFGPKAVQAAMGSTARVKVTYTPLADYLSTIDRRLIYGTFLDGDNIYNAPLTRGGALLMGNEGSGVSAALAAMVGQRLYIPPYPADASTAESLNVGIATAIALSQFRARIYSSKV